jgi:hypothetical protein
MDGAVRCDDCGYYAAENPCRRCRAAKGSVLEIPTAADSARRARKNRERENPLLRRLVAAIEQAVAEGSTEAWADVGVSDEGYTDDALDTLRDKGYDARYVGGRIKVDWWGAL